MAKDGLPEGIKSVMGWVLGIGIIAFIALIMVVIFGNLQGNVGFDQTSSSFINETTNFTTAGTTPTTADNRVNGVLSSIVIINGTAGTSEVITSNNYTIVGVVITADATSAHLGYPINITGTVTYDTQQQIDADSIILNYTTSATNTAAQLPTVGTIIGIAILLLILITLLIFAIRKMMGVAGASGGSASLSGSNKSFQGGSREFS